MKNLTYFILLFFIAFPFLLHGQTNYYVATDGDDSNAGTDINAPWLTIQHAIDNVAADAVINVRGGVYNEKINWASSGTAGMPIVLKNHGEEEATISGNGLTGQEAIIFMEDKSHLEIKNMVLENNYMQGARGIHVKGEGENITIEGCAIRNIGFTNDPAVDPRKCIADGGGAWHIDQWPDSHWLQRHIYQKQ